jgi:hypothetical protein
MIHRHFIRMTLRQGFHRIKIFFRQLPSKFQINGSRGADRHRGGNFLNFSYFSFEYFFPFFLFSVWSIGRIFIIWEQNQAIESISEHFWSFRTFYFYQICPLNFRTNLKFQNIWKPCFTTMNSPSQNNFCQL